MTTTELRALLADCLKLWDLEARITAEPPGLTITTASTTCVITSGPAPTRWFLTAAGRTRPAPSIPALLSALRRSLGVSPGIRARVGAGAAPQ